MADRHDVAVLDNLSTGREQNLAHLRDNPRVRFYRVDVTAGSAPGELFAGVDVVLNIAKVEAGSSVAIFDAGGGGFLLLFVEPHRRQAVKATLGPREVHFNPEPEGSQIIYYRP